MTVALIGVPTSAGAHWAGQEKTPRALREAGLVGELLRRGVSVNDRGDLPLVRWSPDPTNRRAQNPDAVVRVASETALAVRFALDEGELPVIIGGDCTITVGVVEAFQDVALLYFDGHADLNTPATSPSGVLDSMGLAHMLRVDDSVTALGERSRLTRSDVVLFGINALSLNPAEERAIGDIALCSLDAVRRDPARAAHEALSKLKKRFVVHFDMDVIDFADLPLANVAQYGEALAFDHAVTALEVFASSPQFAGLCITEVNPDHGEAADLRRLNGAIARVLEKTT